MFEFIMGFFTAILIFIIIFVGVIIYINRISIDI